MKRNVTRTAAGLAEVETTLLEYYQIAYENRRLAGGLVPPRPDLCELFQAAAEAAWKEVEIIQRAGRVVARLAGTPRARPVR